MRDLHEHCGVVGVMDLSGEGRDVVRIASRITRRLWHRGHLGAGIATMREGITQVLKGNGPVLEVLSPEATFPMEGATAAIGHTRYATCGSDQPALAQPFISQSPTFAIGFNGTVTNYPELKAELEGSGEPLEHDVDTEVIRRLTIEQHRGSTEVDVRQLFGSLQDRMDGAFNITLLTPGMLAAYRDKHGFRPLSYGMYDDFGFVASENSAIESVFPDAITGDVPPGYAVVMAPGMRDPQLIDVREGDPKHCFFEWVYFSHYLSKLDGASLRTVRERLGRALARRDGGMPAGQRVIAVPESSIVAAEGYAEERRLRTIPALRKNQDRRNFIEAEDRLTRAGQKYIFTGDNLEGESVVLIDDSIVRGDTLLALAQRFRKEKKVREIHVRLSSPPLLSPCVYGIDLPEYSEFIVRRFHNDVLRDGMLPPHALEELAAYFNVDSIAFLTPQDVAEAIGKPRSQLCMACVDGNYPTPAGRKLYPLV